MLFKTTKIYEEAEWEEIPDEELWEDGEADSVKVAIKIYSHVSRIGDWTLIRRTQDVK
tara:strand:+ start:2847 stop:3020 length:174 start_codon:yes stop_codon:yes gene_type:complete